jgi:3,4-dihydroxy 2-butanone 4-phosphate synthase/GTP cyclohydrolase II
VRLSTIEELLEEFRQGRPIIMVDDEDRENEGDLLLPAEHVTPEWMAFIIRHTGGVVCVALTEELADRFELPPMVHPNTAPRGTAFTVSIEARRGVTTGISAFDRATTIHRLVEDGVGPQDFVRPGHVFPLRARPGGVLERPGHTEAAVDLARLAGLKPAVALSELMNDRGEMMRLPEILRFAETYGLKVGSVADLIRYRLARGEGLVRRVAEAHLPTREGDFRVLAYRDERSGLEHAALVMGIPSEAPILVRVHSECLTGDVFHSLRCDCGAQRDEALRRIAAEGRGIFVYLRQEGRGIGLANKIQAYALQDQGLDTVEANLALGFPADLRDYGAAVQILRDLGVGKVRLLTNNPKKLKALTSLGLEVVERVPLQVGATPFNQAYLATKREKLGHWL